MKILPTNPAERRRQLLLLGFLLVTAAATYWLLRPAGPSVGAAGATDTERVLPTGPMPVPEALKLASLDDVPMLTDAGRNPFGFGVRPPPPPPPPPKPLPAALALPPAPTVPPPPPGPPPIGLKLTGLTTPSPGARVMVTLKDPATNAIYLAHEGDIVDGRYKVVRVGQQSVVVSYVDGTGPRTLPLGG